MSAKPVTATCSTNDCGTDSKADNEEDVQKNPLHTCKPINLSNDDNDVPLATGNQLPGSVPVHPSHDEDSAPYILYAQKANNMHTQETPSGKYEPASEPSPGVVLLTENSDSPSDVNEDGSPDDFIEITNPATKESLSAFSGVRSLRVRILNLAATLYEISAEASDTPFLKAQFSCPPSNGCCGGGGAHQEGFSGGPFTIDISEFSSVAETALVRVSCSSTGSVMVESPQSVVIGYVAAERILCGMNFIIRDMYGTARMVVKGPCFCRSKCSRTEVFEVLRPDQTTEAAKLSRANGAHEYTLTMPKSMTAVMKASLLCASLLFDRKMFA